MCHDGYSGSLTSDLSVVYSFPTSDAPVLEASDMYRLIKECISSKCCSSPVESLPGVIEPVLELPFRLNLDFGCVDSACSKGICLIVTV